MNPSYKPEFANPEMLDGLLLLNWLSMTSARQEYFMSDTPRLYTYGSLVRQRTYRSQEFTVDVLTILGKLNNNGELGYNVCFLNRYDDQKNQLGWHADDSPTMDSTHPIAVVSFGAEREIWWKHKSQKGVVPDQQRQLLGSGSLFIMPAGFQTDHVHRIPKCNRPCGLRISLTFRKYK